MFEAELEMERKESSVIPLVLVLVLAGLILGGIGGVVYMVVQTKKGLPTQDAAAVLEQSLKQEAPAAVHFHTGTLKSSVNEKPGDPHYTLLQKLGILTFKAQKDGRNFQVSLTPEGEKKLAAMADVQKTEEKDGTISYTVPLAGRRLVEVSKVTMDGPSTARVIYSWRWEPNEFGNGFDAAGPIVKGFNQWDRATLIQKYSADFYHGEPIRTAAVLNKKGGQWTVASGE
jgi:hypothetical protein